MMELRSLLNPPQAEAVEATEGPLLILAGAGSGKTRVLTYRIAYLIGEKHVAPWNILAITFTNKAADEMRSRVCSICENGESVFVSTFHSACVRFLRSGADRLGYGSDFSIYDTEDCRTLMRHIIKSRELDPKQYRERDLLRRISSLKNDMVLPEDFSRLSGGNYRENKISEIYTEYQKRLMAANAMDFDDLLVNAVRMLRENEDLLERYRQRFKYILVDEYQDTNKAQFQLVELLAHQHRNICVVGDDDQSIYRFRGADIRNILDFEKYFPGTRVIRLEQNYRSTKSILAAANAVIAHNTQRKEKTLWTALPEGEKPLFRQFSRGDEEAVWVAEDILEQKKDYALSSTAVLYRTNAQSRALEEAFVRRNIPYRLVGGTGFYERREVKDILAYLKTVANGADDVATERIINVPRRGIGETTVGRVRQLAEYENISFYDALLRAKETPALKNAAAKLKAFTDYIQGLREKRSQVSLRELIEEILVSSGYEKELLAEDSVEAETRLENIRELENKAAELSDEPGDPDSLNRFLEEVALVAQVDAVSADEDKVVLMTLHSAKGLEFPKVYMVGMEQGLFPGSQSVNSVDPSDIEEERRLCYVGITRAQKRLVLTAARTRMVNGETQFHNISQFIEEIPAELLCTRGKGLMETKTQTLTRQERRGDLGAPGWRDFGDSFGFCSTAQRPAAARSLSGAAKEPPVNPEELHVGDRVRHSRFGPGTILAVEDRGRDREFKIRFDDGAEKSLLGAFARLQREE